MLVWLLAPYYVYQNEKKRETIKPSVHPSPLKGTPTGERRVLRTKTWEFNKLRSYKHFEGCKFNDFILAVLSITLK